MQIHAALKALAVVAGCFIAPLFLMWIGPRATFVLLVICFVCGALALFYELFKDRP